MTDTSKTAEKTPEKTPEKTAAAPQTSEEPRLLIEELVESAHGYLDVPGYVAAGAFSGVRTKTLPLSEAKALVKDFMKRPVEMDLSTTNEES